MTTYIFNEAGSIPGVPGTFANCQVDIDEASNVTETPLAQHPAFEAESEEAEAAPISDIVQEQAQPAPVPYVNIGG